MVPDKIYVSNLIYDSWQYTIPDPDDETEVEYIRKDALLEWAKSVKADPMIPMNIDKVIEKIESL